MEFCIWLLATAKHQHIKILISIWISSLVVFCITRFSLCYLCLKLTILIVKIIAFLKTSEGKLFKKSSVVGTHINIEKCSSKNFHVWSINLWLLILKMFCTLFYTSVAGTFNNAESSSSPTNDDVRKITLWQRSSVYEIIMNIIFLLSVVDAYDNARFLCEHYYMCSPDLNIESYNRKLLMMLCYNSTLHLSSLIYHI